MPLFSYDINERVWRGPNERYAKGTISEATHFRGNSVAVWAGISIEALTNLPFIENGTLNARGGLEKVLEKSVKNAKPHIAQILTDYLNQFWHSRLVCMQPTPESN
ncbi:hypothetical protein QE152_g23689 [Popillia japonica]|uniref:Uncharacterized protein n=1 Tax=Popillia japonica TaxID=7064 RepID=A0AAW1KGA0_POPJA